MSFGNDADISMSDRHISLPLCHIGQSYYPGLMTCRSWLILSQGESIMHFLFLTLYSSMSCWELEIGHVGSIYTTEMGKCQKLRLSFFKEQFSNTPLTQALLGLVECI